MNKFISLYPLAAHNSFLLFARFCSFRCSSTGVGLHCVSFGANETSNKGNTSKYHRFIFCRTIAIKYRNIKQQQQQQQQRSITSTNTNCAFKNCCSAKTTNQIGKHTNHRHNNGIKTRNWTIRFQMASFRCSYWLA